MLLIRRDEDALMRRALEWPGRLVYLIDDDIAGAIQSPDLPSNYRRRLAAFDEAFHQRLLARANVLVVPSAPLASILERNPQVTATIRQIFPHWPMALADARHFELLVDGQPMRIVHLGSASHSGAFGALAPVIADILTARRDVHFTYFNASPQAALPDRHPQIDRIAPKRWPVYRRWLGRQRFHLALYPLDGTPFDVARSPNKLVEHAIVGAVGIYSEHWLTRCLTEGGSFTAPADPADWTAVISDAIEQRAGLAALAERARCAISTRNNPAIQRAFWSDVLDLDVS